MSWIWGRSEMATTIQTNPRDIGVDGNQVMISPAVFAQLAAAEELAYELRSAIEHDPDTVVSQLVLLALAGWERLERREAGDGD